MADQDDWRLTSQWREWTGALSEMLHRTTAENLQDTHDTKRWADRNGDTNLSQICAIKIECYGQYQAEFNQRDQAAREQYQREHREWEERSCYAGSRNGLWDDVLRWARTGELPPDWRDHLPGYLARCMKRARPQPTADVDGLVLHEFATLPPQPWEPYVAGGDWRTALDTWYRDTLALHNRRHRQRAELDADKPRPFASPMPPDWAAIRACRDADFDTAQAINHDRKRDRIEAWYRASLAAGGDDEDWAGWYRDRISTWDRRHDAIYNLGVFNADRALADLGEMITPAAAGGWRRVHMHDDLPDYWLHQSPT